VSFSGSSRFNFLFPAFSASGSSASGPANHFARTELASTLENSTLFQKKPEYRKALQVVSVPERIVQFRVVWEDDKGQVS